MVVVRCGVEVETRVYGCGEVWGIGRGKTSRIFSVGGW